MYIWLIFLTSLVTGVLSFFLYKFQYWQRKGVRTLRSNAFIGNWLQLQEMSFSGILKDFYVNFKKTEPLAGFYVYTKPVAVIFDLDLIKCILIKDFNKFSDRMVYKNEKDALSISLFSLESEKWRNLRNKFTPTFTSAKVKYMFPKISAIGDRLKLAFERNLKTQQILNISNLSSRFTLDNIVNCIFGIESNSLEYPDNECLRIARSMTSTGNFSVRWRLFLQTYISLIQRFGIPFKVFPPHVYDFFLKFILDAFKHREKLDIRRQDMIDMLIDLRKSKDEEGQPGVSYNEIASQLLLFFGGGYETSTNTISFALYELARHPDIQEKVRQEILSVLLKNNKHELSYEDTKKMPYLDQTILETLRLYPPLEFLERTSTEDYPIPNSNIVLDEGTKVFIPLHRIHYDPEIYENPKEFRPQRFHPSEVNKRHPQAFLAFGDGPRNCIGLRLGRIEVMVALITLLSNFKFSVCEKTVHKFEMSKHIFTLRSLDDVWLKVEKLEDL